VIESILESEHSLASIITTPDKKSGRGQNLTETELASWAQGRDIVVAKPDSTSALNQHLLSAQPQLIVTLSYGKLIPVELLHGPRFGWLNVHFSLLPRWRGAAPVQWALLEGDRESGLTIFKLDKGMDTGPIYFQESVPIAENDTTESLLNGIAELAGSRIIEVVSSMMKGAKPVAQPQSGITLAPKISKDMSQIQWSNPTEFILRHSRALAVRPGTWSNFRGERIAIHGLEESLVANTLQEAGELALQGDQLLVRTHDSVLKIHEVTPAGKKRMSAAAFARGIRLSQGEKFEFRISAEE